MAKDPSSFQAVYTEQLAAVITEGLIRAMRDHQPLIRQALSGGGGNNQTPNLPDSMIHMWAGKAGEEIRKLALQYFQETGLFPQ